MAKMSLKCAIIKITKITTAKVLFSTKKAWVEVPGRAKWQPKFDLRHAFYTLSSLGKLYIRID